MPHEEIELKVYGFLCGKIVERLREVESGEGPEKDAEILALMRYRQLIENEYRPIAEKEFERKKLETVI